MQHKIGLTSYVYMSAIINVVLAAQADASYAS